MLTKKQIEEIRTFAEKAENPLFFYDDDPDGLCSFLIFILKIAVPPTSTFPSSLVTEVSIPAELTKLINKIETNKVNIKIFFILLRIVIILYKHYGKNA